MIKLLKILWASPVSFLGVCFLPLLMPSKVILSGGALFIKVKWLIPTFAVAQTWGHVVFYRDTWLFQCSRDYEYMKAQTRRYHHELYHVRQCERWGPLMIPLYIGGWVLAGFSYRNNYWERKARGE